MNFVSIKNFYISIYSFCRSISNYLSYNLYKRETGDGVNRKKQNYYRWEGDGEWERKEKEKKNRRNEYGKRGSNKTFERIEESISFWVQTNGHELGAMPIDSLQNKMHFN